MLQRLPDLDGWWPRCQAIGLTVGLRERLLAPRLLSRLQKAGQLPDNLPGQLRCLAPLLASSARELADYEDLVERWTASERSASDASASDRARSQQIAANKRYLWAMLPLLGLLLTLGWLMHNAGQDTEPVTPPAPAASVGLVIDPPSPTLKERAGAAAASAPRSAYGIAQQPFPIPEPQAPNWAGTLRASLAALALASAAFTAWRLWRRWRNHRLFAETARVPEADVEQRLLRDPHARPLTTQGAVLGPASRLMRQRQAGDAIRLAVTATIQATIKQGGLIAARWQALGQMPEYLALIERHNHDDHLAAYHEVLIQALQKQGVAVEVYYFRGSPSSGVWRLGPPQQRPDQPHAVPRRLPQQVKTFEALVAQYPRHRLMVFSDAAAARHSLTGEPATWTSSARRMGQRVWFTPLPVANWGDAEDLVSAPDALDFVLLPMEQAALRTVAEWLGSGRALLVQDERSPQRYPPLLQADPDAWAIRQVPPPKAVQARLMTELRGYLGPRFMPWLAACALYPALAWPLTLLFGRELLQAAPADPAPRVPSLPTHVDDAELAIGLGALGALPWFRVGRLPNWLRRRLVAELSPQQVGQLRTRLVNHLEDAWQERGEVIAPLAKPRPNVRRRQLAWWLGQTRGDLADVVLLRFLDPALAPGLAARLPETIRSWLFPDGVVMLGLRPWIGLAAASPMLLGLLCLPPLWARLPLGAELPTLQVAVVPEVTGVRDFALSGHGRALALISGSLSNALPNEEVRDSAVLKVVHTDRPTELWPGTTPSPLPGSGLAVHLGDSPLARALIQGQATAGLSLVYRFAAGTSPELQTLSGGTFDGLGERGIRTQGKVDLGDWFVSDADLLDITLTRTVLFGVLRPDLREAAVLTADGALHLRALTPSTNAIAVLGSPVDIALGETAGQALLYSENGQQLWVGLASGDLRSFDASSGAPLALWPTRAQGLRSGDTGAVTALARSPDGERLAAGHADGQVTVWDTATRQPLLRLQALGPVRNHDSASSAPAIVRIQFSPDGRALWLLGSDGLLRRHGDPPEPLAVAVVGCADDRNTPPEQGAAQALAGRLAAALQAQTRESAVAVLQMPPPVWRDWGFGSESPGIRQVQVPANASAQALGARVVRALQDTQAASPPAAASAPGSVAWRAVPAAPGLAAVSVDGCGVLTEPKRLSPKAWPSVSPDARLQQQIDAALTTLWQPDRGKRPEVTQALLNQPDLVSDLLPRALSRAVGLAEGKDPGSPDSNSRITQVLRLAQVVSPVTLQRNAVTLYRLIDKARPLGDVARAESDRLEVIMRAAEGQVPQVHIVLGAGAGAQERTAASRLAAAWQRLGLQADVLAGTDPSVTTTGVRASGASDRALARWLLQQTMRAQSASSAEASAFEALAAASAGGDTGRAADSYRLVLAPPVPAAPSVAASSFADGQQQQQQPASAAVATSASAPRSLRPGDRFRDCEDETLCPRMVVLPAGEFLMGSADSGTLGSVSERPQHKVTIARPFAMMDAEVTRAQYAAFTRATNRAAPSRCEFSDFQSAPNHPVICVSWPDAVAYAEWLSAQTDQRYSLPTEAEWEYAARAGSTTEYHFGNDPEQLCQYANVLDASAAKIKLGGGVRCDDGFAYTAPVRSFRANAFGLYDMHGNVWEWVQDCWHDNYRGAPTDRSEWRTGCSEDRRVLRGGGWGVIAYIARAAFRNWFAPDIRNNDLGFRLARTVSP